VSPSSRSSRSCAANSAPRSRAPSVFRCCALVALVALAACGGGGDQDDGPVPDGSSPSTTAYVANRAGTLLLTEGMGGFINFGAFFYDRTELPLATRVASEGDCEVWTHPTPPAQCTPPCVNSFCLADDHCEPFPNPVDHGEIVIAGLDEPLRFTPFGSGYVSDPPSPPEQLFSDGAAITASAAGADGPGFTLEVTGVADLEADLDLEDGFRLTIEDGVDEVIGWTAADSGRIQLALLVGHHGSPFEALLVCETEDDGELVVPGRLITEFPHAQPTGLEQHSSWLARFSRDVLETDAGPIELFLSHRVMIPVLSHP
jgi:hypothetical protein